VGWTIEQARKIAHLMDPADQQRYQERATSQGEPVPPPKTDKREKDEQRQFANWILLQRSKGRKLPFCWHATHKASTASPGTPDFWVGTWGGGIWLEFKRDWSTKLSEDQQAFFDDCKARGVECYVVYSAQEAIKIVNEKDELR
jgi:hypothetical protein